MKKYKVLKPFYKLSESKNYMADDTIDMYEKEASALVDDGILELIKTKK